MAMFDKHKSSKQDTPDSLEPAVSQKAPSMSSAAPASAAKVALIGQGISISGDIKADTSLKIEGRIEGRNVQCSNEVDISESGQVIATIMAKVVKISGTVSGDIGAGEKVFISRTGRVQGNIIAPRVQLEDGALFRGSIDMNPAESAEAKKPAAVPAEKVEKAATAAPERGKAAAAGTTRKEPGLNLKSG